MKKGDVYEDERGDKFVFDGEKWKPLMAMPNLRRRPGFYFLLAIMIGFWIGVFYACSQAME